METNILKYVNEDRHVHGLEALQMNAMESSLALKHSQDMASGKVRFGHDGFNSRAKIIQNSIGSIEIGENVASGQMTAREVVDGWLNSPAHKKNIEGNFILTGIGYARDKKGGHLFYSDFFPGKDGRLLSFKLHAVTCSHGKSGHNNCTGTFKKIWRIRGGKNKSALKFTRERFLDCSDPMVPENQLLLKSLKHSGKNHRGKFL